MSKKSQNIGLYVSITVIVAIITVVALIGYVFLADEPEVIQGQVEVSEYRVSSKVPGRILELKVQEGDMVHEGDTLAILEAPEVTAQAESAKAAENAAAAMSRMANNGARKEQIQGAYQLWQQALAAEEIAKKSYTRMQHLYDEGVISGQKRDEVYAAFKAAEAQVKAAKSQYDMANNGARTQEKQIAANNALAAKSAVKVVSSLLKETVQVAQVEGEVSSVYPKVGELVGIGSPIMSISILSDMWGTFNVREDQLNGLKTGDTFTAFSPAFNKDIKMKVYSIKDEGSFAVWKATKTTGQYDLKTFEVKARPVTKIDGLRPGMSLIYKK